ncbi:hypothetical protein Tco_0862921, partial [Tanacetum coccineum]
WRFFIHTILYCLSPKKTAWEQFSSNIATAIICLATTRTFNFSKFIFDAMVKNLDNPHKFLMYPRFIQICLNKQRRLLQPHTRTYSTPVLTHKVFSNMKSVTKGYSGEDTPLFASMINASETSPSRITSSPSLSPQHTPFTAPSTSQPSNIHITTVTEEAASMPHESPLQKEEETAKLVEEPTKLVEDQGSGEKGEQEVTTTDTALNTASIPISTASATPKVSTAAANLVYIRRSAEKRKDKEQIDEEERKRIARDAEIAKQLQEEYDKAGKKEAVAEVDTAHVIDWNDPFVIRYHALQNRPRSVAEVRKNMLILKRAGQDVETKPAKRQRTEEVSESVQEQTDEEPKTDELSQEQLNQMVFEDMLKNFDRDDLIRLWSLVQERYNSSGLTEDKEIEL